MIIYNNVQELISNQGADKWLNIGMSQKSVGDIHAGHERLLKEGKKRWPTAKLRLSVWSDDWWMQNLDNSGSILLPGLRQLNKIYMINWAKSVGVDAILFMDYQAQDLLFSSPEYEVALQFFEEKNTVHNYTRMETKPVNSFIKWCMATTRFLEATGLRRDYVLVSDKDGWFSYALNHFYNTYTNIHSEVLTGLQDGEFHRSTSHSYIMDAAQKARLNAELKKLKAVNLNDFTTPEAFKNELKRNPNVSDIIIYEDKDILGEGKKLVEYRLKINVNEDADVSYKTLI